MKCTRQGVTISNDGATIMKLLDIVHPAAKSLVDVSLAQDAEVGWKLIMSWARVRLAARRDGAAGFGALSGRGRAPEPLLPGVGAQS